MRSDMPKVIVERARVGGREGRGRAPNGSIEMLPLGESMRRAHVERKELNENLSPLRRYLRAQTGRPWDKVFADISLSLRSDSTVQQHVRDHLFDFVGVHVMEAGGRLLASSPRRFREQPRPLDEGWFEFYVDPRTGILRVNLHRRSWRTRWRLAQRERAAEVQTRRRVVAPLIQLHKLRGCWFEVRLARHIGRLPAGRWSPADGYTPLDAVIDAGMSGLDRETLYGRGDVYAVSKQQLGKRDLVRNGLRNE